MAVLAAVITVPLALHNAQKIAFVFAPGIFAILCVLFLVLAALRFVTGWSLLKLLPWGRTFALVMAFTALIHPPLDTALGVYSYSYCCPTPLGTNTARCPRQTISSRVAAFSDTLNAG
jgi:hypothetical protein